MSEAMENIRVRTSEGEKTFTVPQLDATLSDADKSAQAKAVGDALATEGTARENADNQFFDAIGVDTITEKLIGDYEAGQYWDSRSSAAVLTSVSGYTAFDEIEVTPGRTYMAYIRGGSSSKQYPLLFVDAEYTILEHSTRPSNAGWNTYTGTVPENAKYALITANSTNDITLQSTKYDESYTQMTSVPSIKNAVKITNAGLMDFLGKHIAIIGDSISTNGNYSNDNPLGNVPEIVIGEDDVGVSLSAYVTYYDIGTTVGGHEIVSSDVGTELTFTPIADDIGKMVGVPLSYNPASRTVWWEVMAEALGFTPIPVCWSGASITSHEGNDNAYNTSYAWHEAQIRKCGIRTPGSMTRTAPDIVIIYRGTNDFSHTPYARLTDGYFNAYPWTYPTTDYITQTEKYGFKEGIALTVKKLRAAYPNAKIFLCTLNVFKRVHYDTFPTYNSVNTLPQFNNAIREAADFLGCGIIEFDKDGITFENCYSEGYLTDDPTTPTHPSDKGHLVMGDKALRDLISQCNSMG